MKATKLTSPCDTAGIFLRIACIFQTGAQQSLDNWDILFSPEMNKQVKKGTEHVKKMSKVREEEAYYEVTQMHVVQWKYPLFGRHWTEPPIATKCTTCNKGSENSKSLAGICFFCYWPIIDPINGTWILSNGSFSPAPSSPSISL